MEEQNIRFFSNDLLKLVAIGVTWYIVVYKGFSAFFVQFGFSPLVTISEMLGGLIVPIVPTYFLARYLHQKKEKSFLSSWIIGCLAILLLFTIGMLNTARQ